jgi:hypothetical protein
MPRCEESRPCLPLSMPDQRCWTQQLCMWDPSRFICVYIYIIYIYIIYICILYATPSFANEGCNPFCWLSLLGLLHLHTQSWRILAEVFVADIAGKIVWLMDFPILLNLDYHQI